MSKKADRSSESPLNRAGFRRATILVLALVLTALFLYMIRGFLKPLFLAAIFSGLLYPVYLKVCDVCRGKRAVASIVTLLLALILVVGPTMILAGLVVAQAIELKDAAVPWVTENLEDADLVEFERTLFEKFPFLEDAFPDRERIKEQLGNAAVASLDFLVRSLRAVTTSAASFFVSLFVMLYAMFFFFTEGPNMVRKVASHLPLFAEDRDKMLDRFLSVTRATIKGSLVIGILQGTLGAIAFRIAGIEGAAFWGAVMIVLSVIPGIGAAIVWIPAVGIQFAQGQVLSPILLTIWFAAAVGSIDNVLRPVLVGRDTQMPDILILVSTLGGILMFGLIGFIAGPILCALFLTSWTIYGAAFQDALGLSRDGSKAEVA